MSWLHSATHVKVQLRTVFSVELPSQVYRARKRGRKKHVTLTMQSPVQGEWPWPARPELAFTVAWQPKSLFYKEKGAQNDRRPMCRRMLHWMVVPNQNLHRESLQKSKFSKVLHWECHCLMTQPHVVHTQFDTWSLHYSTGMTPESNIPKTHAISA